MPSSIPTRRARTETRTPSPFWLLAVLVLPILNLSAKYRFHHTENLPDTGAFVLAPNHYSEIDPLVVAAGTYKLGRAPRFLAKASLFSVPVVGALLRASGQIPVERTGNSGHRAVKAAEKLVADGGMVIVYPEGSLTRDPELWPMRGKTGAVRIALERGIPVVPCAHWGTQQIMARYSKKIVLFRRKRIDLSFGPPVDLDRFRGRPLEPALLAEATAAVMADITRLLEELRGEKAPAERWDPTAHRQTEHGRFDG